MNEQAWKHADKWVHTSHHLICMKMNELECPGIIQSLEHCAYACVNCVGLHILQWNIQMSICCVGLVCGWKGWERELTELIRWPSECECNIPVCDPSWQCGRSDDWMEGIKSFSFSQDKQAHHCSQKPTTRAGFNFTCAFWDMRMAEMAEHATKSENMLYRPDVLLE